MYHVHNGGKILKKKEEKKRILFLGCVTEWRLQSKVANLPILTVQSGFGTLEGLISSLKLKQALLSLYTIVLLYLSNK